MNKYDGLGIKLENRIVCELCDRIIPWNLESKHHLVPRELGGKGGPSIVLHNVCHSQIHALISNKELKLIYNSIDRLKEHEQIKKFIKWIKRKPISFSVKTKLKRIK